MNKSLLILVIPALIQLILLAYHLVKTRGWKELLAFFGFGLVFGYFRSSLIRLIQITINHSVLPYEFSGGFTKIGNDSLVVYLGWITTAYLAWQFGKLFLKKFNSEIKDEIFPLISFGFIFIMAFSYLVETAASYGGWWHWNTFLETGFNNSIFLNVPWVGIVDWGTVAFEYLGIYLVIKYVFRTKDWRPIFILFFPFLHWASHINNISSFNLIGTNLNFVTIIHFFLPFIAIALYFLRGFKETDKELSRLDDNYILFAAAITYLVAIAVGIIYSKNIIFVISLIPISLIFIYIKTANIKNLFLVSLFVIFFALFSVDKINSLRIITSIFPAIYLALIFILEKTNFHKLIKNITIPATVILVSTLALSTIPPKKLTNTKSSISNDNKNIILISIDTLRFDHLSQNGYFRETSPNLDKIAKEGTSSAIYSPVPYTLPAHLAILSGTHPFLSEAISNADINKPINTTFLSEELKSAGFKTGAFVSTSILDKSIFKRGFDVFNFEGMRYTSLENTENALMKERTSQETLKQAGNWVKENKDYNTFAWIHLFDAHSPYKNDCGYTDYSSTLRPKNEIFANGEAQNFYIKEHGIVDIANEDFDYLEALYDEEIRCLDKNLGIFFDDLKKEGIYDSSEIYIVGDHGENFDHNSLFHGHNLYEGAVKVPLITSNKNIGHSQSNLDLTDLKNIILEYNIDNQKLTKNSLYFATKEIIVTNKISKTYKYINHYAIKEGNYKLHLSEGTREIYNIKDNGLEADNLSNYFIGQNLYSALQDYFKF